MTPLFTLASALALLSLKAVTAASVDNKTYEYIVVGSGPGGAPLAANLARAGHSVLLLEAGDDQTENVNVSQWQNFNAAGNDPATRWDFFVRHSGDSYQDARFKHRTWRKPDGTFYVGTEAPPGSAPLGIYYPRAGTLGGCAMHNGCLTMLPNDADWDDIAKITGDNSWSHEKMRKYLVKLEKVHYNSTSPHGHDGYLDMTMLDPGYTTSADAKLLSELAAQAAGYEASSASSLLQRDMNGNQPDRDNLVGPFGGVSHINPNGRRSSPGYYVRDTANAGKYPLTISLDTLATKIIFDKSGPKPKAVGIEYLQGKSLYGADPRYNAADKGTPGKAFASKEVIISGGTFNSPQLLLLSGIGPREELNTYGIPLVLDLPGVGKSVADNYEIGILSLGKRAVTGKSEIFPNFYKTTQGAIRDIYMWCGSFAFEGFWPGFPNRPPNFNETYGPNQYECALVHMNPRSQAGVVQLQSPNPREVPVINLNFFEQAGSDKDLQALYEGVNWVRSWLSKVDPSAPNSLAPFTELHPCQGEIGKQDCTVDTQKVYIKEQSYSHHATSSCKIGADSDRLAVLDSKFRVRGVTNLRVVDASSFPKVPGGFPVLPTMMLSEKATEDILAENN
ncbi:GMC oxidoreductase [Cucurbitaria berberidis CBS 394.84]|uniref:GMC oxidoreductase n=1 Tax=Cucurbitaria berberidis CBS 394.84 TaxID=1168544 RepID=A0A9P4LCS9_9PLEO|nr:GMC oxidoreductase [Cucurbitaria berberidis CBS 394.84]KAF1851106.1 GMC oxidoreductase [Cucurbitaria berberidis CBS 394.84]